MPIDIIREAFNIRKVEWKKHALKRLLERGIKRQDVKEAIASGEIIETYEEDKPFRSFLILGYGGGKPLHIVLALDETNGVVFVITAYIPSPAEWENGWKNRRKK